jgi:hypothetical protein
MPDEMSELPPDLPTPALAVPEMAAKVQPTAPASGKRSSFRDIRRQLSEEELKQSGVQKLLIEDFERAENECEVLRLFVERYHESDKEVGRLTEKLKTNIALEIITGAGLAGGGAIVSLATMFYPKDTTQGIAAVGVGFFFLVASTVAKIVQGKK